jgi:pimeloyl-ACP methyl ester carboxylesterase
MFEQKITFRSDALALAGVVTGPDGLAATERRPGVVIMHGFGGHKNGPQQRWSSKQLAEWGYVCLRFDFRGCGESEGDQGLVRPDIQIADAGNAVSYMLSRPDVDSERILLIGTSYGASVAVCAAARDARVSAVIAQGGWGIGENLFRSLHNTPETWGRFTRMVEDGRAAKAQGRPWPRAHRYDIVPVPEGLRANIDGPSTFDFSVETADAFLSFNPETDIAHVSPRPVMLIHAAEDLVVPAEGSIELFRKAGKYAELYLIAGVDHFMFGENEHRVIHLVQDWLGRYFPLSATPAAAPLRR